MYTCQELGLHVVLSTKHNAVFNKHQITLVIVQKQLPTLKGDFLSPFIEKEKEKNDDYIEGGKKCEKENC